MNSLYLQPTTEQEIIDICTRFCPGTAEGYDQIAMNVIKEIIDLIVQPLTYITNLSLSSGTVPDQMKIARVFPLLIFLGLPVIDQFLFCRLFLERIVYNRLINFLNKFNILYNKQYGFRKNHYSAFALIQFRLYDKRSDAIDQGKVTLGLFIDLSKACDTINHDISSRIVKISCCVYF